jgi:hypothetical protein
MSADVLRRYAECIATCNACAVACQHCASLCLQEPDVKMMARCIALDFDCAELCSVSVALMAGGSELAPALCAVCARACRMRGGMREARRRPLPAMRRSVPPLRRGMRKDGGVSG